MRMLRPMSGLPWAMILAHGAYPGLFGGGTSKSLPSGSFGSDASVAAGSALLGELVTDEALGWLPAAPSILSFFSETNRGGLPELHPGEKSVASKLVSKLSVSTSLLVPGTVTSTLSLRIPARAGEQ